MKRFLFIMACCLLLGCAQRPAPSLYQPYVYNDKAREALGLAEDVGGSIDSYTELMTYAEPTDEIVVIDAPGAGFTVKNINVGKLRLLCFSATITDPHNLSEDEVSILPVEAEWAPNGITLYDVGIKTDNASSYSVNFEEWTAPDDGAPSTIETVATSSSREAEDDGTLTDSSIAAGSIVYVDLPTTEGTTMLVVWGTFTID